MKRIVIICLVVFFLLVICLFVFFPVRQIALTSMPSQTCVELAVSGSSYWPSDDGENKDTKRFLAFVVGIKKKEKDHNVEFVEGLLRSRSPVVRQWTVRAIYQIDANDLRSSALTLSANDPDIHVQRTLGLLSEGPKPGQTPSPPPQQPPPRPSPPDR